MPEGKGPALHSNTAVCRLTGLNASTLRSWERRFGVPKPSRTDGGRRLYDDAEVERLVLVASLIEEGHDIGELALLTLTELRAIPRGRAAPTSTSGILARLIDAAATADLRLVRRLTGMALVSLPPEAAVDSILLPLMRHIGDEMEAGRLPPHTSHAVSAVLEQSLYGAASHLNWTYTGPIWIVATVEGERHEIAALSGWHIALSHGCNAIYLGPGVPIDALVEAARGFSANHVILSAPTPATSVQRIADIRARLPAEVVLWVGAPASHPVHAHAAEGSLLTFTSFADYGRAISARTRRQVGA